MKNSLFALACLAAGAVVASESVVFPLQVSAWKTLEKAEVRAAGTAVEIVYAGDGKADALACAAAEIPAALRGERVVFTADLENPGDYAFGNGLSVAQYAADGRRLAEDAVDPRFITQMRPAKNRHDVRVEGSVHPQAAEVELRVMIRGQRIAWAPSDRATLRLHAAKLERAPERVTNPAFFTDGVDGAALDLHEGRAFGFTVYSRACWGQGRTVTDPHEVFYPVAEGTVEAWLRLEKGDRERHRLFEAANFAPGAANAKRTRGALMGVDWAPAKDAVTLTLKGRDGKAFAATGTAKLGDGAWHHLAVTFAPEGAAEIFVDGARVASAPLAGWLPSRTGVELEGPMMFFLGGDYGQVRLAKNDPAERGLVRGAADALRISSAVRYRDAFTPAKAFGVDAETRALFGFERDIDGLSAGGGGRVEATILAKSGIDAAGAKATFRDPPPFDVYNYTNLPTAEDFVSLRTVFRRSFDLAVGESATFEAGAKAIPDFTEIANTGNAPLVAPLVIAPGEIDPRSFDTIARTLELEGRSDREKVDRIFQWLIRSTDYFISHPAVVPPQGNWGEAQGNHPLKLLNSIGACQCGGLNNLTACTFVQSGRVPADRVKGYGHEFESCLFDGKSRLYDLSGQQFFRSFADGEPASLQDVDREYGLHARYGKCADHFSRLFAHAPMTAHPYWASRFFLTLSPGECFRWWRRNDGTACNVSYCKKNAKYVPHPLTAPAPAACTIRGAYLINRYIPEYANGFLLFDGAPDVSAPAFAASDAEHLVYRVDVNYTVGQGAYRAELADGGTAKMEVSWDGKHWTPLTADDGGTVRPVYEIRGRSQYLVRALAKPSAVKAFHAVTEFQMNARVLTGLVRRGANELKLIADGTGQARVTVGWRENAAPISVDGAVVWGTVPGAERMLAAVDPAQGATILTVKGVERVASRDPRLTATLADGRLTLTAERGAPHFAVVRLYGATGEKSLSVLVGEGVRLVLTNPKRPLAGVTLTKKDDAAAVTFPKPGKGRFFVFNLERTEGGLLGDRLRSRVLGMTVPSADGKRKKRARRPLPCGGGAGASDFYKAPYGVPGGRGNVRWDYPQAADSRYPMGSPMLFDGTNLDRVDFRLLADVKGGFELFAALVVPEGDFDFKGQLIKMFSGLNHDPDMNGVGE